MAKRSKARKYNEKQVFISVATALNLATMIRLPFGGKGEDKRLITELLFKVYLAAAEGKPLHKKAAWREIEAEDIKTGRKYISRVIEDGLVEVKQSKNDRRMELLLPTEKLSGLVRLYAALFALGARRLTYDLLEFPLPEYTGPQLRRGLPSPEFPEVKYGPLEMSEIAALLKQVWDNDFEALSTQQPASLSARRPSKKE